MNDHVTRGIIINIEFAYYGGGVIYNSHSQYKWIINFSCLYYNGIPIKVGGVHIHNNATCIDTVAVIGAIEGGCIYLYLIQIII